VLIGGIGGAGGGVEVTLTTGIGVGETMMVVVETGVEVGVKGPWPHTLAWKSSYCVASAALHAAATLPATSKFWRSLQMQRKSEGLQELSAMDSKTMVC